MTASTTHRTCGGCQTIGTAAARVVLDVARTNYVRALRAAFEAGVPLDELAGEGEAAAQTMRDVLALAGEGNR